MTEAQQGDSPAKVGLCLEFRHITKTSTSVTLRHNGEVLQVDSFNLGKADARRKFVESVAKRRPDVSAKVLDALDADLLQAAGRPWKKQSGGEEVRRGPVPSEQAIADALEMLRAPDLIKRIIDDIGTLGVSGEKLLAATIYLVGTSRLLRRPLAAIVQGLTSSGKSYVVDTVANLFPLDSVVRAHTMTPQALVHMGPNELVHRFIVAGERSRRQDDDSADATRALREMISDGRLSKLMPSREGNGIVTIRLEQEGPIAYVESTTLQNILDEDRNRCIVLGTDETPEQTRRIVQSLAASKMEFRDTDEIGRITEKHRAAQCSLQPVRVEIPYAGKLAELFPSDRTDARRSFGHLLSMIEAVAFLYQYQRIDDPREGKTIVATRGDYDISRRLLAGPFSRSWGDGLSDAARHFAERIKAAFPIGTEFDVSDVARSEIVIGDQSTIRSYVRILSRMGILTCTEAHKGPKPARYEVADFAEQESSNGLPTLDHVFSTEGATTTLDKT